MDGLEEAKTSFLGYTGRQLDSLNIDSNSNLMYSTYPESSAAYEFYRSRNQLESISQDITIENNESVRLKINEMIEFAKDDHNEDIEPLAFIIFNKDELSVSLMRLEPTDFERNNPGRTYNPYDVNSNSSFPGITWARPKSGDVFGADYEGDINNLIIIGQVHGNTTDENFSYDSDNLAGGSTWNSEMVVNSTSGADAEAARKMGVPVYEIDIASGQINKIDPLGNSTQNIDVNNLMYDALNTQRQNAQPIQNR